MKGSVLLYPLEKGQVGSCSGSASRCCSQEMHPHGRREHRGSGLGQEEQGRRGEDLPLFTVTLLPWRAQPPQGPKATSTQPMDISCSTAPPRARSQQETRQHAEPSPASPAPGAPVLSGGRARAQESTARETEAEALGKAERPQLQGRWSRSGVQTEARACGTPKASRLLTLDSRSWPEERKSGQDLGARRCLITRSAPESYETPDPHPAD